MFLEEKDHLCEESVASSRTEFQELSGGREDEGYKGNIQTFFRVLIPKREFQFLTF